MLRPSLLRTVSIFTILGAVVGARADAVDRVVQSEMAKQHIAGLSLAVIKSGKILTARGYGWANLEHRLKANPETVYEIGSITKQFTATAIMMLVEEGKIQLEDPISQYIDATPTAWKDVTIRHLLTHTSGIKSYTELPLFIRMTVFPTTPKEVVKLLAPIALEFKPGEKWKYSNSGFYLLGMIVEKASGKPYARFLQDRIFGPLGMSSTRVNDLKDIIPNRAAGYDWNGKEWKNAMAIDMTWPYSAGAIVSTVQDMAKWDAALYTEKLVKASSLRTMWTPARLNDGSKTNYGFGWQLDTVRGHRSMRHTGGIPGFITQENRYPDDRLTVVVFTNIGQSDPEVIAQEVAATFIPDLAPPKMTKPPR